MAVNRVSFPDGRKSAENRIMEEPQSAPFNWQRRGEETEILRIPAAVDASGGVSGGINRAPFPNYRPNVADASANETGTKRMKRDSDVTE